MGKLELFLLGAPDIRLAGEPVAGFRSAKARALLYYLAATGQLHTRLALAGLLWGQWTDRQALVNLSITLTNLRRLLGDHVVISRDMVGLKPQGDYWVDISTLRTVVESPASALDTATLRRAVELYRGDFLEGFYVHDAPEFETWLLRERAQWREGALQGMRTLAAHSLEQGQPEEAIGLLRRILALEPWREEIHRQLMTVLAGAGQRGAALAQYELCRMALAEELAVEPAQETVALYQRIRQWAIEPEAPVAPPIQTPSIQAGLLHNLPGQLTPFVGRSEEVAELMSRFRDPECRLLTLVGPGGMGKTRLALKAAQQLLADPLAATPFADGIFFVSLAPVMTPAGISPAIADAIGLQFFSNAPVHEQVVDYLREKQMLLILDNFEHLLDGVELDTIGGPGLVSAILMAAPGVTLLVTSRDALKLLEEWFHPVAGMAIPHYEQAASTKSTNGIADSDAVQLFAQNAQRARPGFSLEAEQAHVARICQLVEGMPLAIELAAAWLRTLPAARVAAEVAHNLDILTAQHRNMPERHRSMRAVLEQSWLMLSLDEQEALKRLSLFRGGFMQEAAEEVAAAPLLIMAVLVEKALVRVDGDGRYQIHELLRQFAEEKLHQSGDAAATHRGHAHYFLRFVYARRNLLLGKRQRSILDEIGADLDNIRLAWMWAVAQEEWSAIDEALEGVYFFHKMRSRYQEGQELMVAAATGLQGSAAVGRVSDLEALLSRLLASWGDFCFLRGAYAEAEEQSQKSLRLSSRDHERVFAFRVLGVVAGVRGRRRVAEETLQECLALARRLDDAWHIVETLHALADFYNNYGEFEIARRLAQECVMLSRQMDDPYMTARALGAYAWASNCLGAYDESAACWQECHVIQQQIGDQNGVAVALNFLGWCAWCVGGPRLAEAKAYYEQALAIYHRIGTRNLIAMSQGDLALALTEQGEYGRAREYAMEGHRMAREIGHFDLDAYNLFILGAAACGQGDMQAARSYLADSLTLSSQLQVSDHLASALFYVAKLLVVEAEQMGEADPIKAQQQMQALDYLHLVLDHAPTWQAIKDRAARLQTQLQAEWPPEVVAAAHACAAAQTLEQAVEKFLQDITRSSQ